MRYVFNDHFILVCVFLLGGLGFYYSEILKKLPQQENFVWGELLVLVVWLAVLMIGNLATLTQEADKVFIIPKERQMKGYLNRALVYSFWLPAVTCLLIGGFTMPLLVISSGRPFTTFFYYLGTLLLLKLSHLKRQEYALYQIPMNELRVWSIGWFLSSAAILAVGLYLMPIAGLALAAVQVLLFFMLLNKKEQQASLDWEGMIQKEKNRMHRIYQFIHLFTDVPEITGTVKRRRFADPLLNRIKKTHSNTYLYLYARSFLRGSEYSGLFFRLLLVGGIILLFLSEFWLALGVALIFVYLIGFQLIPIYTQFDYMVLTHLYPVSFEQKKKAVNDLLTILLSIAAGLFGILALIALPNIQDGLIVLGALIVEVVFFTRFYVAQRLKKMEG